MADEIVVGHGRISSAVQERDGAIIPDRYRDGKARFPGRHGGRGDEPLASPEHNVNNIANSGKRLSIF
jgi:hypothetical protein